LEDIALSTLFIVLAVLIGMSGFFSSSETSLMALNKYRLRHRANEGHRAARVAQHLLQKPDRLIGLILLGNNLVNILAASIATVVGIRMFGDNGLWISTMVMTVVVLIFAEVAPKTVAALHPERIAYPAAFVLTALQKILFPVVWLINGFANLILRPFGITNKAEIIERLNREELRTLLKEGGQISDDHQRMLINILDLEHATVDDVMIPRQEITGIDLDDEWEDILSQIKQTVYTRLPVYRETMDDVVGLLHIRSILARLSTGNLRKEDLKRAIRSPYFIPEGTPLTQQLLEFQHRERSMGLVVDEYGDIQGLITRDDILEEIVGEYTADDRGRSRQIRRLDDGNYLVDGATSVHLLNRRLGWDLEADDAKTLGGIMLQQLEDIPDGKASVRLEGLVLTIAEIRDNTITKVLVKPRR
jgi:Mg2+/Co2+ transporter CorB